MPAAHGSVDRVRNRYWCEVEDREISYGEIGKGYEMPGGRLTPVTDEELRALPLPTARAIELIAFIPASGGPTGSPRTAEERPPALRRARKPRRFCE
ncbi:Ku protein [Streptomyces sp. NPDC008222]|uniref:Ku protein n=1 Tax=Streptomyces sp. NPDC008222 TaxID=3364820 RepID=UPI0036E71F74